MDKEKREIVNQDDWDENFWGHYYQVHVSEFNTLYVNQACERDALDEVIDYCTEKKWEGLFLNQDEVSELGADGFLEDYVSGGNEGRYLSSLNVHIAELVDPLSDIIK